MLLHSSASSDNGKQGRARSWTRSSSSEQSTQRQEPGRTSGPPRLSEVGDGSRLIEIRPLRNPGGVYWHERRITPSPEEEQIMNQAADEWILHEAAMELHCPRCSAAPDEQCVTASGNPARSPHMCRTNPLATAYGNGYEDGYRVGMLRASTR